jgi:hypothetical protein
MEIFMIDNHCIKSDLTESNKAAEMKTNAIPYRVRIRSTIETSFQRQNQEQQASKSQLTSTEITLVDFGSYTEKVHGLPL